MKIGIGLICSSNTSQENQQNDFTEKLGFIVKSLFSFKGIGPGLYSGRSLERTRRYVDYLKLSPSYILLSGIMAAIPIIIWKRFDNRKIINVSKGMEPVSKV